MEGREERSEAHMVKMTTVERIVRVRCSRGEEENEKSVEQDERWNRGRRKGRE
jgi:hypothetical protein